VVLGLNAECGSRLPRQMADVVAGHTGMASGHKGE